MNYFLLPRFTHSAMKFSAAWTCAQYFILLVINYSHMQSCWHAEMLNFSRLLHGNQTNLRTSKTRGHSLNKHSLLFSTQLPPLRTVSLFLLFQKWCVISGKHIAVLLNTTPLTEAPAQDTWRWKRVPLATSAPTRVVKQRDFSKLQIRNHLGPVCTVLRFKKFASQWGDKLLYIISGVYFPAYLFTCMWGEVSSKAMLFQAYITQKTKGNSKLPPTGLACFTYHGTR